MTFQEVLSRHSSARYEALMEYVYGHLQVQPKTQATNHQQGIARLSRQKEFGKLRQHNATA
jgi:hypothetical protein